MNKNQTLIYQIKVTLRHVAPPVWRRIEVPGDIKLGKLHRVLQIAMGWTDSHLHAYHMGGATYGTPDPEFPNETQNERGVRLDKVVGGGDTLSYEYDFGDGWEHMLKVEKIVPADPTTHYPRCTAGSRACPPEDCGGPPGYEQLLGVLSNPKHEEYETMREWTGGGLDPEAFDLGRVNQDLWRTK
ncbi:MAG: plasmid pRiA4b ORF-3 family protein [Acidiferrobacter sp.]